MYRVIQRFDLDTQVLEILDRHRRQAAIVYCISRKDTENLAGKLQDRGVRAAFYHAGMNAEERRKTQDAFAAEQIDVVVATVAFGMGIDRSDVRAVIHAAMPKSIEHYQQETGRAGRDGLEAECVLLYSAADVLRWESLIEKSASEAASPDEVIAASRDLLEHMRRFCNRIDCRHRTLSQYFGQLLANRPCGACDVCLNEIEGLEDSTITAQKILSCVARTGQQFGAEHIVDVLVGADTERVRRWRHQQLSTYGLMKDTDHKTLTNMLYQLLDDGLLDRTAGDRPVFKLNENSMAVLRGHRAVQLLQPKTKVRKTRFDEDSWEGVNRDLFEVLRTIRLETAEARRLPSYVLFSDATLREMARLRPGSPEALLGIRGVGERKVADLGPRFLEAIAGYCKSHGLPLNTTSNGPTGRKKSKDRGDAKQKAFELFAQRESLEHVAEATDRAVSTVCGYLVEFIQTHPAQSVDSWVTSDAYGKVADAVKELGSVYLKPIFDRLEGTIPYEQIRIVVTHLETRGG